MKITSEEIRLDMRLGEESGLLNIYDGLKTPISDDIIVLSNDHRLQVEQFSVNALGAFGPKNQPKEKTLVQTEFGLPTLVSRVDCSIQNGVVVPYEMEDSPSGIGISDMLIKRADGQGINQLVTNHYQSLIGGLPAVIISSSRNHGTDDVLLVGEENYLYEPIPRIPNDFKDRPIIVKSIPGDTESAKPYLELTDQALAPLSSEGDKNYLIRLNMCDEISDEQQLSIDEDEYSSQVVKALIGSMAMGISVYLSGSDRKTYGKAKTVTISRLKKDLKSYVERDGSALLQDFVGPLRISNSENRSNMILRVFTLASKDANEGIKAKAIGGCYVARHELVVHGAGNSISGAVLV